MSKMPSPSKVKELPQGFIENKETPDESELNKVQPEETPKLNVTPEESKQIETTPEASPEKTEKPSDLLEENCVMVGEQKIEIKPTKLKYFRNKAASAYGIIKVVPLHELLTYGKGVIDETRDADQLLYDFLVAAFDDSTLVRDNYDNFDADTIERIVKIFGRINHIDEKEEAARKNREAQVKR
jgi:hypothetical protein